MVVLKHQYETQNAMIYFDSSHFIQLQSNEAQSPTNLSSGPNGED